LLDVDRVGNDKSRQHKEDNNAVRSQFSKYRPKPVSAETLEGRVEQQYDEGRTDAYKIQINRERRRQGRSSVASTLHHRSPPTTALLNAATARITCTKYWSC